MSPPVCSTVLSNAAWVPVRDPGAAALANAVAAAGGVRVRDMPLDLDNLRAAAAR